MFRSHARKSADWPIVALLVISSAAASDSGLPIVANEVQKIVARDTEVNDRFGWAVAMDGDTVLVGAYRDDGLVVHGGAVYVFVNVAGVWTERAKLLPRDPTDGKRFGCCVAIEGDTAVVGANEDGVNGSGAAYVFTRAAGTWSQQAKLLPHDPEERDWFGYAARLEGDTVMIGAPHGDCSPDAGAVYVFERAGQAWTEVQKIVPVDGEPCDTFGRALDIDGDLAVIGNPDDDDAGHLTGSAYAYVRQGQSWALEAKILTTNGQAGDKLGNKVAIEGERIAISAIGRDAVHLFERASGTWIERQTIVPSDAVDQDSFGQDIALDRGRLLVGAIHSYGVQRNTGAVYLFESRGERWHERIKWVVTDGADRDLLGATVGFSGDMVVSGARKANAAYAFPVPDEVGTTFCLGDGTGAPCPCGNESDVGVDAGCRNSTGVGGFLVGSGSTSASADSMYIVASDLPPARFVALFASLRWVNGGLGAPFGDGLVGVGVASHQTQVRFTTMTGAAAWGPGLVGQGGWLPGDRAYYQAWYRDGAGSPCGTGFNATSGLYVDVTQ